MSVDVQQDRPLPGGSAASVARLLVRASDDVAWSAATVAPDPQVTAPLTRTLDALADHLLQLAEDLAPGASEAGEEGWEGPPARTPVVG